MNHVRNNPDNPYLAFTKPDEGSIRSQIIAVMLSENRDWTADELACELGRASVSCILSMAKREGLVKSNRRGRYELSLVLVPRAEIEEMGRPISTAEAWGLEKAESGR